MKNNLSDVYDILMDYRRQRLELELQVEALLDTPMISQFKFYLLSNKKKRITRKLEQEQLQDLINKLKQCERTCCEIETWLRMKTAIPESMCLKLLKFLLSEYEHSEVLIRKRNMVNDLTRKEILSMVRDKIDFSNYSYDYYQFLLVDAKEVYELPVKNKYNPLFYVFDMETGTISETITMGHPKLAQGIMEFLNYRITY